MDLETTTEATKHKTEKTYAGSCHCGAVQFGITADLAAEIGRASCRERVFGFV
jgi:hypothetical protein